MTQNKPVIEVSHVSRYYGTGEEQVRALDDVSLTVYSGEMVAIIGQSGSGKSTLMNILGCLDQPTKGDVHIDGIDVATADKNELADLRGRKLGFIFQRYHLLNHLTADENIAVPAIYAGMPEDEIAERTDYLAEKLGIAERLEHYPSELSGGQQQRVSIARALINGAHIILADEPTGALDSESGKSLMRILHDLHAEGHTIVIVTHDPKIAKQAERVIEIADGKIVADFNQQKTLPDDFVPGQEQQGHLLSEVSVDNRRFWERLEETILVAFRTLGCHRLRTFLSTLGIIIGITSVVISIAVSSGAKDRVLKQIESLGKTVIQVQPGTGWGSWDSRNDTLTFEDARALGNQAWVARVSPVIESSGNLAAGAVEGQARVIGVEPDYFALQGIDLVRGRFFSRLENVQSEAVALIDDSSWKKVFPGARSPVGQVVLLNGTPLVIIGVAKAPGPRTDASGSQIWIPINSLRSRISGDVPLSSIQMNFKDNTDIDSGIAETERVLERIHGVRDFFVWTDKTLQDTFNKASESLAFLITSIAAISLVVGGVGVMNIMLVSVAERIGEIGIRQAVGARPSDIRLQFLVEAVIVCLFGGTLGVILSIVTSMVNNHFNTEYPMTLTLGPVLCSCLFSVAIGVLFGWLPAQRAAHLDPAEALTRQ